VCVCVCVCVYIVSRAARESLHGFNRFRLKIDFFFFPFRVRVRIIYDKYLLFICFFDP